MVEAIVVLGVLVLLAATIFNVASGYDAEADISDITGKPVEMDDLKFYKDEE